MKRDIPIPDPVRRMRRSITEAEGRRDLFFNAEGRPMRPQYARHDGRGGFRPAAMPRSATYEIQYPFRPSLASVLDMVAEHERTGERVVYDEERWDADPRIEEQAGGLEGGEEFALLAAYLHRKAELQAVA